MRKGCNNKIIYIIIVTLVLIEISSLFLMGKSLLNKNVSIDEVVLENNNNSGEMFAILLEQEDGEYEETDATSWPNKDEYKYNISKSGCMDLKGEKIEGALRFYRSTNKASVEIQGAVSCYLFFDKIEPLVGDAYALLVEDGDGVSFVFTRSETPYTTSDTYEGNTIINVYTGIETTSYSSSTLPWYSDFAAYNYQVKKVEFKDIIRPKYISWWFRGLNVESFDVEKLDLSTTASASATFAGVTTSEIKGIEYWDVSNIVGMTSMFNGATINADLDLSNWETAKLSTISYMFSGAKINNLNLSGWDLSKVTNVSIFAQSAELTNVDMSNWNLSSATDFSQMFKSAKFTNVNMSNWNVSSATNTSSMFESAEINSDLGLSSWNVSSVTNMSGMFNQATINVDLDLSSWSVSNVTDHSNFINAVTGTGIITEPTWTITE